jgi:hypothetical protein
MHRSNGSAILVGHLNTMMQNQMAARNAVCSHSPRSTNSRKDLETGVGKGILRAHQDPWIIFKQNNLHNERLTRLRGPFNLLAWARKRGMSVHRRESFRRPGPILPRPVADDSETVVLSNA